MLKRQNRLARGVKFGNVIFSAPQFILKIRENGLSQNRFGIVVSKKVDKRASERNKIKRIFRDVFFALNKKIIQGHDMLFITRPKIVNQSKEEISVSIIKILKEKEYVKE